MKYNSPPTTIEKQIEILESRGMKKVYNRVQRKRIIVIIDIISNLFKPFKKYNTFIEFPNIPIASTGLKINKINLSTGVRV